MTACVGKINSSDEIFGVRVRRKNPRMLDSQGIGVLLALSDRNNGQATVESVEIGRVV